MINPLWKFIAHRVKRRKQRAITAQHLIQTFHHPPVWPGLVRDVQQVLECLVLPSRAKQNRYRAISKRGGTADACMAVDEKSGLIAIKMARDQVQYGPQRLCKMAGRFLTLLIMKEKNVMRANLDLGMRGFRQIGIEQRDNQPCLPLGSDDRGLWKAGYLDFIGEVVVQIDGSKVKSGSDL